MTLASKQDRPYDVECRMSVETPEQIQLIFQLAGIGSRMAAYAVDLAIRGAALLTLGLFVMLILGSGAPEAGMGVVLVVVFVLDWAYHTVIEWAWNGYTPGKKIFGLRVVRTNGVSVDLLRSAVRNLLRAADLFPFAYATGILVMFFTRTERRLGDLAADTMVIREEQVGLKDLPPMPEGLSDMPVDVFPVSRLTQKDIALMEELFRRYRYFTDDRRSELAEILLETCLNKRLIRKHGAEKLLAAVLKRARERRTSWFGSEPGSRS